MIIFHLSKPSIISIILRHVHVQSILLRTTALPVIRVDIVRHGRKDYTQFGQFQNAIQEWFGIPIDEQKVLKDKKIISLWKTSKFSELKLTSKSHLLVLTKSPTSSKRKNKASENKNSAIDERIIEGNIEPHPSSSQVTQNNEASNVKLIRCLSDVAVDILVTNFIKALNIPNG